MYYVGKLGQYFIVHVQCSMGSISPSSSIITVSSAIDIWTPTAVIMVGIAFGKDQSKQHIGDVLVSEAIIPYNIQKVTTEKTIQRGIIPPAGQLLINRFRNGRKGWEHRLSNDSAANVFYGSILSGESLIDNLEYRDSLFAAYPTAIGGEMEGAGLFAASSSRKVEWIVVKGICDFADGNKSANKDQYQKEAADAAVSLCSHICSIPSVFKDLSIESVMTQTTRTTPQPTLVNKILYDLYTPEKEIFYYKRNADNTLNGYLASYSIWISGVSGCGKTTLILRNLYQANIKFKLINFAHCVDFNVFQIFYELYLQLKEILDPDEAIITFTQIHKLLEGISSLIASKTSDDRYYLFIEEIPVPENENLLKEFIVHLNGLLILHKTKNPNSDLKLLLSSIECPKKYIKAPQFKIHETFKFLVEDYWDYPEINGLLTMLSENLGLVFTEAQTKKIITVSKGSPRFLKNFLRDYIASKCTTETCLDALLSAISQDLHLHE